MNINSNYSPLKIIDNTFTVGKRYSKAEIKNSIQQIYDSLSIHKVAKSTTIKEYFEVIECKMLDKTNGLLLCRKLYSIFNT